MNKLKQKKCKVCKDPFTPFNSIEPVCAKFECRVAFAQDHVKKSQEKRLKEQRKETKARKEAIKTKSEWMKEAQFWFNKFIRIRDANKACISGGDGHNGQRHAGHFRSVGSAPNLRFNEDNCHGQCAHCNNWLSGNQIQYRIELINRIGLDKVEQLESDNEPKHYTIDDIKQIKATYKAKCKELENV